MKLLCETIYALTHTHIYTHTQWYIYLHGYIILWINTIIYMYSFLSGYLSSFQLFYFFFFFTFFQRYATIKNGSVKFLCMSPLCIYLRVSLRGFKWVLRKGITGSQNISNIRFQIMLHLFLRWLYQLTLPPEAFESFHSSASCIALAIVTF